MLRFLFLTLALFAHLCVSTTFPSSGIAYNIKPFKGVGNRDFLSTTSNGDKCDLWDVDDDSGRQQWVPYLIDATNNIYNIKPWDGISGNRWFLSTTSNGDKVDLWNVDDGSGRQKWKFIQIGTTPSGLPKYRIQIVGGTGNRVYLSTVYDGTKVDLWNVDDNSGRQQWVLTPLDMDLVSVSFDVDDGEVVDTTPTVISDRYLCNDTPVQQSQTWSFTRQTTETSSYTYEAGFTISVSFTKNFGTPAFASGSISLSASTSHTWTTQTTTSETTTENYQFPVNVPADSGVRAQAIIIEAMLDVPYTATFQSQLTGQTVTQTGTWQGVTYGSVIATYDSVDLATCNQN